MAYKCVLAVALILCAKFLATSGQSLTISPLVIEGREGDTVMFSCIAVGNDVGADLAIDVDAGTGTFVGATASSEGPLRRVDDGQFANFTYGPLTASDNNTLYRCSTRLARSPIAVVSVIFAPTISRVSPSGDPVTVREGEAITVELNVSANPPPSSYEWTRDMQQVVMDGNGITVSLNSIVFDPTSRTHSGIYRLVANNSAGSSEYSFTLDVQHPPEFPAVFVSPNTFNCVVYGDVVTCASLPGVSATFFCDAVGNPLPTVNRSVSGVSDQSNIDLVTGRDIVINSVNANNAGTFSCVAMSEVLSETVTRTRTIRLYVGGVAQPLSDVNVNIGDSSVEVSWSYDNSRTVNPVPARYFVATVTQDGMQIGTPFMLNVTTTSITIPGSLLQAESMYTVSVIVRNLQGDSEAVTESITLPVDFNFNNAIATSVSYTLGFLALMLTALLV